MEKIKISKDKSLCLISIAIITVSFAIEKIIEWNMFPGREFSLILAFIFTLLLAVVVYIISKSRSPFYALLAALIGYKMMPPPISSMQYTTAQGDMLYFIVQKVAIILFVILIFKFYNLQEKPRSIKPLAILAIMFAVPFFMEIAGKLSAYLYNETGSMLYSYFSQFLCYIIASVLILIVAFNSNYDSMRFAAYFEFVALGINILRKAGAIAVNIIAGSHVSKSYYCWIAIYAVMIIAFYFAKRKKKIE